MNKTLSLKDLVVGKYYKNTSGVIFKVEHLEWHAEGAHKSKVSSLRFIRKDGTGKSYAFLDADTVTDLVEVDGFEYEPLEIENKRLRETLQKVKEYAASFAEFNPTYEKIVKMCEEGEGNEI